MLNDISGVEHIYIAVGYTDLRRGNYGLRALVEQTFSLDPYQNCLFLFCGKIIRADYPLPLFEGSLATLFLLAGIMTAKYTNAMTFYRLEEAFSGNNTLLTRQTMARWMIRAAEVYFSPLYNRLKQELLSSDIIHADGTIVNVARDGRLGGTKSCLRNYTKEGGDDPVVLFEYQKTREHAHAKEFLKDFSGWICCDGNEAYHHLSADITVMRLLGYMQKGITPMR